LFRVKICGITREEDLDSAVHAGADAVGFISGFPASPRNISLQRAGSLAARVPPSVSPVLVTNAATLRQSDGAVRETGIGTLQLYGSGFDPLAIRQVLGVTIIRPYLVKSEDPDPAMAAAMGFDALLTDTFLEGYDGGTGRSSDWSVCRRIRDSLLPKPLVLSGGLTPENVAEGIRSVRPQAVDVSSGVEVSPGIKDREKVAEFVRRAKEAMG
jgi:phosphoribosylanthranilate isomerase